VTLEWCDLQIGHNSTGTCKKRAPSRSMSSLGCLRQSASGDLDVLRHWPIGADRSASGMRKLGTQSSST
jgi:hypothetical protein